jgi:hypothetical protein
VGLWCVLCLYHLCEGGIYDFIEVTLAEWGHHDGVEQQATKSRLQMDSVMGLRPEVLPS